MRVDAMAGHGFNVTQMRGRASNLIEQLKTAVYLDRRPMILAIIYIVFCNAALGYQGAARPSNLSIGANLLGYTICIFGWLAFRYIYMLVATRRESAIFHSIKFFKDLLPTFVRSTPLFVVMMLFMPTFSAMKGAIFQFNEYSWDQTFIEWDVWLHGTDPWLLLQPLLGFPVVTYAISVAYHAWLMLIYGGFLLVLSAYSRPHLREQFLCTFILIWGFIGTILAMIFASVGPCFADPILGIDRFTELTDYLVSVKAHYPILVSDTQDFLLDRYRNRNGDLGAGITAMPSVHVALACLFWLTARQVGKWLGYAAFAFLVIIQIGSVHLAWHYAVDGYVSIAITIGLWKLIGYWTNGRPAKSKAI